jgi:hypothetical protein
MDKELEEATLQMHGALERRNQTRSLAETAQQDYERAVEAELTLLAEYLGKISDRVGDAVMLRALRRARIIS